MTNKKIYQGDFSHKLHEKLQTTDNEKLKQLSAEDIKDFITYFWDLLALLLSNGFVICFIGIGSFFRKPIRRVGFSEPTYEANGKRKGERIMYNMRLRTKFAPTFRKRIEAKITKEEYDQLPGKETKK